MRILACTLLIAFIITSSAVAGPEWKIGEDASMKLSFLGQFHYSYSDDAADKEDFFLRRGRIILSGEITDGVKFFAETDNDNAGKNGAATASTDIQDAFVDVRLGNEDSVHWISAGLILLPFSFETKSGATSLLGTDYNAEIVKLANTFVWRDYGAELHGSFGKKLAYHVGAFDGYDSTTGNKNDDAAIRLTGHVTLGVIGDAPTGWFYSQNALGKKDNYLSLGVGVDHQADATITMSETAPDVIQDSDAFVVDFQSSTKLCSYTSLLLNGAYYTWDNAVFDGTTAFVESGILINKKSMITFKYSLQDPDAGEEIEDYTAGLHYFLKGHNVRAGVEQRWGDTGDQTLVGLQFLL